MYIVGDRAVEGVALLQCKYRSLGPTYQSSGQFEKQLKIAVESLQGTGLGRLQLAVSDLSCALIHEF